MPRRSAAAPRRPNSVMDGQGPEGTYSPPSPPRRPDSPSPPSPRSSALGALALGAFLLLALFALFLFFLFGEGKAGELGRDDGLLGVGLGGDVRRQLEVADRDVLADLEIGHVDGDVAGDGVGLGGHDQHVEDLLDDAVVADHLLGLTLHHQGHVGGDGLVDVDRQEVDVEHVAPHRVALHLLDDRLGALAADLQRQQGVQALVGGECAAQVAPLDADRKRVRRRGRRGRRGPCRSPAGGGMPGNRWVGRFRPPG